MAARTVKEDKVKTLADWVARWPKAQNLGFEPTTREPTIYTNAERTTVVRSFPWKREADTLTVLASPTHFSAPAVAAATSRVRKIAQQKDQLANAAIEQVKIAEANLLDAWRAYRAADAATQGSLRRDILAAEAALVVMEGRMAPQGRSIIQTPSPSGTVFSVYVPSMPSSRRGISLVAATASEAVAEEVPPAAPAPAAPAASAAAGAAGTK